VSVDKTRPSTFTPNSRRNATWVKWQWHLAVGVCSKKRARRRVRMIEKMGTGCDSFLREKKGSDFN